MQRTIKDKSLKTDQIGHLATGFEQEKPTGRHFLFDFTDETRRPDTPPPGGSPAIPGHRKTKNDNTVKYTAAFPQWPRAKSRSRQAKHQSRPCGETCAGMRSPWRWRSPAAPGSRIHPTRQARPGAAAPGFTRRNPWARNMQNALWSGANVQRESQALLYRKFLLRPRSGCGELPEAIVNGT